MGFLSKEELFNFLIPVFNVKKRIINYYGYDYEYIDIWNYLIINKWKKAKNLFLSDIVNDIINVDVYDLRKRMNYEKK